VSREREVLDQIAQVATRELELTRLPGLDEPLVEALRLDSLSRLSLVVALEDHFRVVLPDDQLECVRTLGDLVRLIVRLTPEGAEAQP
jgi:acyl carrier protein